MPKNNSKIRKIKYIIGVDEAGRGPLAGPVTVAAVRLPRNFQFLISNFQKKSKLKLKDSKKLFPQQREEWSQYLKNHPKIFHAVANVSAAVINKIGIQKSVKLAVARVLRRLGGSRQANPVRKSASQSSEKRYYSLRLKKQLSNEAKILLDGSLYAPKHYSQKTIIRGDETVPVISAASIIAKTTRDKKMLIFHKKFPQYGFDQHKGYGTAAHYRTLKKHGLSEIHRKLYCRTFFQPKVLKK
ncbi:MAG: ribonuclease HII [Candidatus Niyogibacteria bacterium]|nr:ribonuclease HII [Candidatus Niyogibacteria bacterium]